MTLTPMKTPIFKSADPEFNHRAAQAAYDLVMKMDEDEARTFTSMVVTDALEETIEKNLRTLQSHLDKVVAKRIEKIKKAALVASVSKRDDDTVAFAQALSMVSKAVKWDEDLHPRAKSGQFRTKIKATQTEPMHGRQAASLGIPERKGLSHEERAQYQDEYRQLSNFLSAVQESTGGDAEVRVHIQNKGGGQHYSVTTNGTHPNENLWNPKTERLIGVEAKPTGLNVGGAAFGLTSALGASGKTGAGVASTANAADRNFGSFANEWTKTDYDPHNSNARLYNRLEHGSKFLGQIAPAGSKVQIAAQFGQFVGSHGPQAEAVIGPHARKTAYRYRGTEKVPDKKLVAAYDSAIKAAKMANAGDPYRGTPEGRRANLKRPSDLAPSQIAAARIMAERRPPTWEERNAGRAVIQNYLMSEGVRPRAGLYNLQLASGNTPPSEGVMLNAEGQIVAQAVGYGDDHYLPFNLKHLKDLKGGEYIRNRSVGGPTSEDIYTGLVAGARKVTVVSRSGTFTVEFEDDFRGGRRHNDKARRMVRRYEQILDAVQSKQVDRMDIAPEMRQAITNEVKEEAGGLMSRREIQEEINRRVDEFKSSPEITEEDEQRAEFIINARSAGASERERREIRETIYNELAASKEYKFRLNGNGYEAALMALQEQFPYYIKVRSTPTKDPERVELGLDRGYVEPGRNRPTAAKAGLYGTDTNQGRKFSASHADYQGARASARGGTPDGPKEVETERGKLAAVPEKAEPKIANKIAERQRQIKYVDSAAGLHSAIKVGVNKPADSPTWWDMSEAGFRSWLESNPANVTEFNQFVEGNADILTRQAHVAPALVRYREASGFVGRKDYEPILGEHWPDRPYGFHENVAYEEGATPADRKKELARIKAGEHGVVYDKPLSALSDAELRFEVEAVGSVRSVLRGVTDELSFEDKKKLLEGVPKSGNEATLKKVISSPAAMDAYLEKVHRVRALQEGVPDTERGVEEGDITLHHVKQTTAGPQALMKSHEESTATARRWVEDNLKDEGLERRLRQFEDQLSNDAEMIKSHDDFDRYREQHKDQFDMVVDVFSRQQAAQRGNIIR